MLSCANNIYFYKYMRILGIETSCDETGIAVYDDKWGLLLNRVSTQSFVHNNYGGVVPELAARLHMKIIFSLIIEGIKDIHLKLQDIDGIAYTGGPGLIGSLMIGAVVGSSLAYGLQIPSVAVHHIEGHLLTLGLELKELPFPFVGLLISGGHTQLILVIDYGKYKILGTTLDDSVGELFDKIAILLGLGYPGGSMLSKMAQGGVPGVYNFPRSMLNHSGLDFSFSGLKTFVKNIINISNKDSQTYANIARALEDAIIEILSNKCLRALQQTGLRSLVIAGGVSANLMLRKRLMKMVSVMGGQFYCSDPSLCTDNGAMIAYVGMLRLKNNKNNSLQIFTKPIWTIEDLNY